MNSPTKTKKRRTNEQTKIQKKRRLHKQRKHKEKRKRKEETIFVTAAKIELCRSIPLPGLQLIEINELSLCRYSLHYRLVLRLNDNIPQLSDFYQHLTRTHNNH